jgi:hypothetical protein
MPGWKGIVGTSFTPDEFDSYCQALQWNAWRPAIRGERARATDISCVWDAWAYNPPSIRPWR